uniref:Uncharacterized protein n=1 Tax=Oryza glumipatula TaxID=40148 RepID=A0A0E0B6P4_9ORYZ
MEGDERGARRADRKVVFMTSELNEVAQSQQEKICSAAVPLVEHFALVLGRKANHSRGMGLRAINGVAEERLRLLAQVEAAEKHAAAAQERADAAEQRAVAMEDQVTRETIPSRRLGLWSLRWLAVLRDGGHEEAPTECSGTKAMPTGAWEVEVQFAENKATSSGYSREEATPVGCWKAEAKPAGTWEDYLVETTRLLSLGYDTPALICRVVRGALSQLGGMGLHKHKRKDEARSEYGACSQRSWPGLATVEAVHQ